MHATAAVPMHGTRIVCVTHVVCTPRARPPDPPSRQGFVRSTTKYWVRNEDVSTVKHHVLQHLPVFQFDK